MAHETLHTKFCSLIGFLHEFDTFFDRIRTFFQLKFMCQFRKAKYYCVIKCCQQQSFASVQKIKLAVESNSFRKAFENSLKIMRKHYPENGKTLQCVNKRPTP
jgi:hypothetical protein